MKYLSGQQIRQMWLDYFQSKDHTIIDGASLVPINDPTLLWINSGVAAIKSYFDGSEIPIHKRLTNVQKCIRTNDIDNVGLTARHHTFFEMLGNFSIGDYFRHEMIEWADEILTSKQYFALEKSKIYITYNPTDLETKTAWLKRGYQQEQLIPLEGNFWQIGSGPCGPNTEVFYDRGPQYDLDNLGVKLLKEEIENDRYIEIWGIVFSQFNGIEGQPRHTYLELPSKNIDTGAGLERIACLLQGKETNFETDLFYPIIEKLATIAAVNYPNSGYRPYRVISDHIRTLTFALADHASFSNEGRGYILRRLLRRALRYGQKIGLNEPFLYQLVKTVSVIYQDFYPYLLNQVNYIEKAIKSEEEKFIKTLQTGETLLRKIINKQTTLSGEDAFKMYDTYGFPIELTLEICQEDGISVDLDGFNLLMEEQKNRARLARKDTSSMHLQAEDLLNFTNPSLFDYDQSLLTSQVIGLFKDGVSVDLIDGEGQLIVKTTPFYAESGGQIADVGVIEGQQSYAKVTNVLKAPNGQHLHFVEVSYGQFKINDQVTLTIDQWRREKIRKNHSSLHLLQRSLIDVLGNHIVQQGSYVSDDYARFDFSHQGKVTESQLAKIEAQVNHFIERDEPITIQILPIEQAKATGAIAPFEEKYEDMVRLVSFGDISIEFCGGTHVNKTGDIGLFSLVSEESIAAGIRRIIVKTSTEAYHYLKQKERTLIAVRNRMKAKATVEVLPRLNATLTQLEAQQDEVRQLTEKLAYLTSLTLSNEFKQSDDTYYLVSHIKDGDKNMLKLIIDHLKKDDSPLVVVLLGAKEKGYPILVYVSHKLNKLKSLKAGDLVKQIAQLTDGSGGGSHNIAFGAAKNIDRYHEITPLIEKIIKR